MSHFPRIIGKNWVSRNDRMKPRFEHSKSNRAKCRRCCDKIFIGDVRIKEPYEYHNQYKGMTHINYYYYHVECYPNYATSASQMPGFRQLQGEEHKRRVENVVADIRSGAGANFETPQQRYRRDMLSALKQKCEDMFNDLESAGESDYAHACSAIFRVYSDTHFQINAPLNVALHGNGSSVTIQQKRTYAATKNEGFFEQYEAACCLVPILNFNSRWGIKLEASVVRFEEEKEYGPRLLVRIDFKCPRGLEKDILYFVENCGSHLRAFGGITKRSEDTYVSGNSTAVHSLHSFLDCFSEDTKRTFKSEDKESVKLQLRNLLQTKIHPHQIDAVVWMRSMEQQKDGVSGGLLCDLMGVGKTLSVLALIAMDLDLDSSEKPQLDLFKEKVPQINEIKKEKWKCEMCQFEMPASKDECKLCGKVKSKATTRPTKAFESPLKRKSSSTRNVSPNIKKKKIKAKTESKYFLNRSKRNTLIVCQASVMHNWRDQCTQHFYADKIRCKYYYGPNRNIMEAVDSDIVVTTFDVVAHDYANKGRTKKHGSANIFSVTWNRIVLDEAHVIRNIKTKRHKACLELKAAYRWALTGTPIVNCTLDLYALIRFLRYSALMKLKDWKTSIGDGFSNDQRDTLRKLLTTVMLRRRLEDVGEAGKLPPKKVYDIPVTLGKDERELYNNMYRAAGLVFKAACKSSDGVFKDYTNILEWVLRLRQICCSVSLIPKRRFGVMRQVLKLFNLSDELSEVEATALLEKVKRLLKENRNEGTPEEETECCCICLSPLQDDTSILRTCKHTFCYGCILSYVGSLEEKGMGSSYKCPMCRTAFDDSDMLSREKLEVISRGNGDEFDSSFTSSKVDALVESLKQNNISSSGEKAVIFSQFVGFINIIEKELSSHGINCVKLVGSMNTKSREISIQSLNSGDAAVMLVSLRAGNTGLNLCRATRVYLMDPWWATATEEQAIARIHRIGQTKPVYAYRFYGKNTVEERVRAIQAQKDALTNSVLTSDNAGNSDMTDSRNSESVARVLLERLFAE